MLQFGSVEKIKNKNQIESRG